MENNDFVSIDEMDDVSSKEEYRRSLEAGLCEKEALEIVNHYSRDNGRTPFHWNPEENAGFTTGTPWLMVNQKYKTINVEEQSKGEVSCKEVTKALKKGAKILLNNCTDYQLKEERIVLKPYQALVLVY